MKEKDFIRNFYSSKRILVTGNTGFKGTWMTLLLKAMGAQVWGFALPPDNKYVSDKFYQNLLPSIEGITYGNIADYVLLENTVNSFCPEIIFHLASHSSLNHSMDMPHYILQTNMMGALNVLEAARKQQSVRAVVVVTSDKVYRDLDLDVQYTEDSILGGEDPYSTSKICQELLTECYHNTFQTFNVASARASNVIGPGDYNTTRLFPYLLDCLSVGQTPEIRNPYSIRSWQSVMDVVIGYLMLGRYLYTLDLSVVNRKDISFNFGPKEDGFITVAEMVNMVCKEFDDNKYQIKSLPDHIGHEAKILKLDSSKAYRILGWEPISSLTDSVHQSVEFVKKVQSGIDLKGLADKYVKKYLEQWENWV